MTRKDLSTMLKSQTAEKKRPDGSPYLSLSYRSEKRIVDESAFSHNDVQIAALELGIVPERYARNQKSISISEQITLLKSSVIIVGLGGLGGCVTEILARIGVGELTLVDGDVFEDSNLNRQLLSQVEDIGRKKALVAESRVLQINPAVNVKVCPVYMNSENCLELIGRASLAVDCLDTIPDRFTLEAGCRESAIPMVSAAIGGEAGQATIIYPEDQGLSLVYGSEEKVPAKGIESTLGTLPYAAVTMAALECAVVVSCLLGKPSALKNTLLFADLSDFTMELLSLS